jgi:ABC-type multidrug transport system ATPase subunit
VAKAHLHDMIRQLNGQQGVTIFLITHDLAEAEKLCHRVAVMHAGRIQVTGRPEELRRQLKPRTVYHLQVDRLDGGAEATLGHLLADLSAGDSGDGRRLSFSIQDGGPTLTAVLDSLREYGLQIQGIESRPATLEEVFAHYSGHEAGTK